MAQLDPQVVERLNGRTASGVVSRLPHLSMRQRGIASASRLMYCISTPMGTAEVDLALDALEDALRALEPGIEREYPQLT